MPIPIDVALRERGAQASQRHTWAVTHLRERFISMLDKHFCDKFKLNETVNHHLYLCMPQQKHLELCKEHRLHLFPLLTGNQYVWIAACIEERTDAELKALEDHNARVPTSEERENISAFFEKVFGEECPHVPLVLDMS